ncbi:ROK family protein, partial [Streptomyces humi]
PPPEANGAPSTPRRGTGNRTPGHDAPAPEDGPSQPPPEANGAPSTPRRGTGNRTPGHDAPAPEDGLSQPPLEANGALSAPQRGAGNCTPGHDVPAPEDGPSQPPLKANGAPSTPQRGAGNCASSRDVPAPDSRPAPPLAAPSVERSGRFLDALADRIAVGVAAVVAVLDPGCVVLGGEIGPAGGAVLAARVEARLRRMSPLATEVRASTLGGAAVLRGALLTARESAQDDLFAPPDR